MTVIVVFGEWVGFGVSCDRDGLTIRAAWMMARASRGSIAASALYLAQQLEKARQKPWEAR